MEFRKALDALFDAELRKTGAGTYDALVASNLTPEEIDKAVCAELIRVCNETYDIPENSDRKNRLGWSSAKIQEHMKRFVRHKIQDMCHVLRNGQ